MLHEDGTFCKEAVCKVRAARNEPSSMINDSKLCTFISGPEMKTLNNGSKRERERQLSDNGFVTLMTIISSSDPPNLI